MLQKPDHGASPQLQEEVRSHLAAREEIGPNHDDQLAAALARQMQSLIAEEVNRQVSGQSSDTTQLLKWRKEILAISMGAGSLMLLVAGLTTGLGGVAFVCAMIVLVVAATTLGGNPGERK